MNVDSGYIVLFRGNLQLFIHLRLVLNAVLSQSAIHIQDLALALPGVAFGMNVYLLVSV